MSGQLLIALGLALGLVAGGREVDRFERLAADEIASRLEGPDKQVRVEIVPNGLAALWGETLRASIFAKDFSLEGLPLFTEAGRSTYGKLYLLEIFLSDFEMGGLHVSALEARITNCRFDFGLAQRSGELRLSRSGEGTGEVRVTQEALADYIVQKYAEIQSANVRVERDHVIVEGFGDFLVARGEFAVYAKLRSPDGRKLELYDARILFGWRRADEVATQVLLDTLNPVIDLDEDLGLHGAIDVEELRLRDGVLTATGRTRIPERPSADN